MASEPVFYIIYRKTENFRVIQVLRNLAVSINPRKLKSAKYFPIFEGNVSRHPIFAEFRDQYQSAKIKIREIFSYFWRK